MQISIAFRSAILAVLLLGSCKSVVREEAYSEAQRLRLRTIFSVLLANDDFKQARFIVTSKLKQGDTEEVSRLIAGQMRRGKGAKVANFFRSWVAESTLAADDILEKIASSKSAIEIEVQMKNLAQHTDLVRTAFRKQREAISAVTEGKYAIPEAEHYLHAAKVEDSPLTGWLSYNSWAESFQFDLKKALYRGNIVHENPQHPLPVEAEHLSDKIRQAWEAIKLKFAPVPALAN